MGYTTWFEGKFDLDKPLTDELYDYLCQFSKTRHLKRNAQTLSKCIPDIKTHMLPNTNDLGKDSKFFAMDHFEELRYERIGLSSVYPYCIDYNSPPDDCPGLWCDWAPTKDKMGIEWNQTEKFYNYVEWLKWLIVYILEPAGYTLNGSVQYQGEDESDRGIITVTNNIVDEQNAYTFISDAIEILGGNPNERFVLEVMNFITDQMGGA